MMSFTKVNLRDIVWKQYKYKLKSYYEMFSTLMGIQLLALLFSFNGSSSFSSSLSNYSVSGTYYNAILPSFLQ